MRRAFLVLGIVTLFAATARADMRITEWMYSGANGEFVEFTNVGSTAIDMTDWHYSDSDRGSHDLNISAFGIVAPGASVILTDMDEASFRAAWGLSDTVKIIGSNTNSNLNRNDEINLYDASENLVDRLTYGDQGTPATVRTQNISGNPGSSSDLGANHGENWVFAYVGDAYGSHLSSGGDIGNPGVYAVPEPTSIVLGLIGIVSLIGFRRRWL
jgi:predicted extracellular nuclease